jgi:hypothetical protein
MNAHSNSQQPFVQNSVQKSVQNSMQHSPSNSSQEVCVPYQLLARVSKILQLRLDAQTCYFQFKPEQTQFTKCRLAKIGSTHILFGARHVSSSQSASEYPSYFFTTSVNWKQWFTQPELLRTLYEPSGNPVTVIEGWKLPYKQQVCTSRAYALFYEHESKLYLNISHTLFAQHMTSFIATVPNTHIRSNTPVVSKTAESNLTYCLDLDPSSGVIQPTSCVVEAYVKPRKKSTSESVPVFIRTAQTSVTTQSLNSMVDSYTPELRFPAYADALKHILCDCIESYMKKRCEPLTSLIQT